MIKVIATGSKGNFYIVQAGEEILLLECGISIKEIKKALDFDLSKVVGCLVTHSHKDHCKAVNDVIKSGIEVYMSKGTSEEIDIKYKYRLNIVTARMTFKVGNFLVTPVEVQHDTKEPFGFVIYHEKIGAVAFLTDTYYLKAKFRGIDHILVECNYSESILENLEPYRARLLKSHMSLETLKQALKTWDLKGTKDITLIHISDRNGEPERFREEIEELTEIKTLIGVPGLEVR